MSREKVLKTKMRHIFGDNMLGVVCYIILPFAPWFVFIPFTIFS
ncbi:MAG: hypothetical protein ACLUOI_17425 [Eisenbergiella sp.]